MPFSPYNFTFFSSCNMTYFREYGGVFLSSINNNCKGAKVAIHVYDPNRDEIMSTCNNFADINVALVETTLAPPNSIKTIRELRTFYASRRFVVLDKYFSATKENILFLDIDSIIMRDLSHIDDMFKNIDIAIHTRLEEPAIQFKLLAGSIYFKHGLACKQFLHDLADAIQNNPLKWFVDQVALFTTLQKHQKNLKIGHLDISYIDWEFSPTSHIWTGKGNRKFDNKKYTAQMQKLKNNL